MPVTTGDPLAALDVRNVLNNRPVPALALGRTSVDGKFFQRGGERWRVKGVTYGPFAPNENGEHFPGRQRVAMDFQAMREASVNAIRTYYVPPAWLLDLADEYGLQVLIDVPWSKHLCFLDSAEIQSDARRRVRTAAEHGRRHDSVLAYSICNEIPANIVRWHGARRVERFLEELTDVARQADPECLTTYANYPSTEYLELPFLDFATFNVYLHDPQAFRHYLFRLQNQVGEKPLLLGELGMDTLRHSPEEQAQFLSGHLREATLMGLAGAFVFAWTDDWFTGGHQIEDWAFGITQADRAPKPACIALAEVFRSTPAALLTETPRVSVVVCSYNGGRTLEQCLRSLLALDYPDYEVILVDDGSTDDTQATAARFPDVNTIHQSNQGLSVARNVGLAAATGAVIAYTDSDCFADPHWLTHLVHQLQSSGASAVGGPNLTPDDGRLAACIAASPGQPTHVLESDEVAEHIPGCNMAFRREALEEINGFDPKYRKAGDDVDLCWRLQQKGMWITFAPGAFVWHHRRQTPRTYMRQQAGYGEAEALLWFDHPDHFNALGEGKWKGVLYGGFLSGVRLSQPVIYRGVFASGLFQTLYQPGAAHWAMIPTTLEWHVALVIVSALALAFLPSLGILAAAMLALSIAVASLRALQAPLPKECRGVLPRLITAGLCYAQPLVRSWHRYRTRLFPPAVAGETGPLPARDTSASCPLPFNGNLCRQYWDEAWRDRTELLAAVTADLSQRRWVLKIDSGWTEWDMELYRHPWTALQICTAQEDHGSGKRLVRMRYRLCPTDYLRAVQWLGLLLTALALGWRSAPLAVSAAVVLGSACALWRRGARLAGAAINLIDDLAVDMKLIPCEPTSDRSKRQRRREASRSVVVTMTETEDARE
jgi:GT2 family glycosyltransferase